MAGAGNEELEAIKADLVSSRSQKRRSAAKKAGRLKLKELENELLDAYLKERCDKRTWETQTEMIKALGRLDCKAVIPYIKEIVDKNKPADTITAYAALSYIRLTRKDINDISVTADFFENGGTMLFDGAVMAMAYDDVLPTEEQMKRLLNIFDVRRKVYERPYSNPIHQMIAFMYKWDNELIMPFLDRYKDMPQYAHFVQKTLAYKRSVKE